jgi:Carboxypeptidase regulatory-like domain/TonB dependent receptor
MLRSFSRLMLAAAFAVCAGTFVQAQGGGSISGVVKDSAGGVIPGAAVVVKNNSTATTLETSSNNEGVFSVPAIDAGTYTITVKLEGFKTAVISDVRVSPGTPTAVNAVLEIGQLAETVTVTSSSELINTQTATISSTLNVDQVNRMPMPSRNALNAVTFLPGVNTSGVNRDSSVNGLPQSFINITMDGVSNNDNFLKTSDGFFASVTPRQDAIEAVTVTTAVGAADTGGHGAVTINFQTRAGTNRFTGSVYEYFRHKALNTNYWFNERNDLPKNDVKLNQYGIRQGGPIIIPGVYDGQGKAFFFVNYEELRLPNDFTRTRSVLHPRSQEGWFRYNVTVNGVEEIRERNVLTLAQNAGQLVTRDPMVQKLQGFINAATASQGVLNATSNPMLLDYVWQSPGYQWERQPVIRIDYNITSQHRLSGTYNQLWAQRDPDQLNGADARFPGSPNYRLFWSTRPTRSFTLRSTLSQNLVSEARVGITRGGTSYFGKNLYEGRGVPQFDDQDGYSIDFDSDIGMTNWWVTASPSWRAAYQYTFDETLTWQKGKHGLSFGGSAFLGRAFENAQVLVPSIQLGFNSDSDPARGLFNTTNFQGASSGELTDARQLYGYLTGRVTSVGGQAALDPETGTYKAFYPRTRQGKMDVYSLFAQDSWRMTPTLTINAGLRWDLQMPFKAVNDVMSQSYIEDACGMSGMGPNTNVYNKCNFLSPSSSGGKVPEFVLFGSGSRGYNIDYNNVAPNVGVAWRPNVQSGFLRTLLGDPELATLRGGYAVAYERQGMSTFTGVYGPNPGSTLTLTRSASSAEPLVPPGQSWPVLLSERSRLQPASFPERPTYPIAIRANRADSLNIFAPDIEIGRARSWTVSFQRAITRDTSVDLRYVGTRGVNQWTTTNYNSIRGENLVANGFIDQFRLAQQNLIANNLSGIEDREGSIAYFGPGTGTHPLPAYLAYIQGRPAADASDPARYTSSLWSDTTLAGRHVRVNPSVTGAAGDLEGNSGRRTNAINAGLPANYFRLNPVVADVNVTDSGAFSDYHALQVEVRRRMSRGLQVNGSYQYALEGGSFFLGFSRNRVMGDTPNVRHAFKTQWDWTVPVGRGQRFGSNLNPILNAVLGGWQFNGVGRVQSVMVDFGNVRLVGMTAKDLQAMYRHDIRINPETGLKTVYMLPDDVILNTRRAFGISASSLNGYGDLGVPEGRYIAPANSADCIQIYSGDCAPMTTLVRAPWYTRFDIGVTKRFPIQGHVNFELRADVLNVFDNVNFDLSDSPGSGATIFQVGSAYRDPSNTFDPGGRLGQLVFRLNW